MTYPLLRTNERLRRLETLDNALQNRLEAIATGAGKRAPEIRITKARIFVELSLEQSKLIPPGVGRQREMRNWRAGKEKYWPPFSSDWAAKLVRKASLRMGVRSRRYSEAKAIEASTNVTYADLKLVEKRAADMVIASDGHRATTRKTRQSNSRRRSAANG